jgi:lipopolysaccharide transport system ATP-binding protein
VKHYSSGMYVRLAFAVAAHLEPEILLVDEVLAVGDAAFQKKCLGKMGDVAREGRTVLFVSHNMGAIQALCNRACWLSDGQLSMNGLATNVVNAYLSATNTDSKGLDIEHAPRVTGGRDIRLVRVELLDKQLHPTQLFSFGNTMILRFHARLLHRTFRAFAVEWYICTLTGERVVYGSSSPQQGLLFVPTDEHCCVECRLESVPLTSGTYRLDCLLSVPHQERLDEVENVAAFQVAACDVYGTGFSLTNRNGLTGIRNSWSIVCGAQSLLPS